MQRTNTVAAGTTGGTTAGTTWTAARSTARRLGAALSPRSTPGGFRLAAAITAAVCALAALFGSAAIAARDASLDDAATAAEQLVDVQDARTAAVQADSIAASSFLVGGEESADRRAAYETQLAAASSLVTAVAQRAPAAAVDELSTVSEALVTYAGLVEQARANNRQGFPVGAAYQRQASALLRTDVLPSLDEVDDTNRDRLNDALSDASTSTAFAVVVLVLALAALAGASWLLWRRTRRMVNVPIAIGALLVVFVLFWSLFALSGSGRVVRRTVDTSLQASDALSLANSSAFDARSAESLTLINRGNGAANEADWQLASARVDAALDETCATGGECFEDRWSAYVDGHLAVRQLDDGGDWDSAVALALDEDGVAGTFAEATTAIGDEQMARAAEVTSGFIEARDKLRSLRWFVLIAGLVAAATALAGFAQRLREYR